MVGMGEMWRRARGQMSGELSSLPILALNVHSACNCRCVMCDIWKANADKRELTPEALSAHIGAIRRLHVQRVMLTGGEPLLNRNLWALCEQLRASGIRITLVTTGLLIETHATEIARCVDQVVVSLDGPAATHDAIRRVTGGVDRIARGLAAVRAIAPEVRLIARCVVQRDNYLYLSETIQTAIDIGFQEVSFLAADVSSTAFNRPQPWDLERQAVVALHPASLGELGESICRAQAERAAAFDRGFVAGGVESLHRIAAYYRAVAGLGAYPATKCNAPWISAVLEPEGTLRPCFFHDAYPSVAGDLTAAINSPAAVAFRRELDVGSNAVCRRCVCSLNLPISQSV
jgi:MoaA/NifB/PqqE/SkfB family radical SAM enzyme